MKREKARKLILEVSRRLYLQDHGTTKGFGRIAKFYRADWMPDNKVTGGYKSAWDSNIMKELRRQTGM